jgi:hypothetical protein
LQFVLTVPLVYLLDVKLLQFLVDFGEEARNQVLNLVINVDLKGKECDRLGSPLVGEAAEKVFIEQLDAVVDNLDLDLLEGVVLAVANHEILEFAVEELHALVLNE